jgi:glycosyltransferase involved in cell wall biosynthesis
MAALRRLDDEGHALRVCMAGSGEAAARLRRESALLKHVTVDFPGALDRAGMAQAYAASRVFVIPSSTHQEGMPLVVAEALHFGLPVIGSDQKMILEGMGAAGLSFGSGNVAHLTDQIRRLTEDESLYTQLSTAARTRSALFLPTQFLSSVQAILHEAAPHSRPRATTEDDLPSETVRRTEPVNQ